jgi:hypothetical protein
MYRRKFLVFSSIVSKYRRELCTNNVLNTPNETLFYFICKIVEIVDDDDDDDDDDDSIVW